MEISPESETVLIFLRDRRVPQPIFSEQTKLSNDADELYNNCINLKNILNYEGIKEN